MATTAPHATHLPLAAFARRVLAALAVLIAIGLLPASASAQTSANAPTGPTAAPTAPAAPGLESLLGGPEKWTSRQGMSSTLQVLIMLTVLSLAPAILLMTTCFVRVVVVFGLLKQALGANQLPPSQVMTTIALFITFFVMQPVWSKVYTEAISPYLAPDSTMTVQQAYDKAEPIIKKFMTDQIDVAGNADDIWLFIDYLPPEEREIEFDSYEKVPLKVILPAFMLSELKVAFLMGFQIFLPFLILDIVVSSVTISMGMMMLPPVMISLPLKVLLFVLVDGWRLVVEMLLRSFHTYA
jgi:flagellar biosynthetic protein FliP